VTNLWNQDNIDAVTIEEEKPMTVIELSDTDAAALKAKATAAGLTLEAWLRQLAGAEEKPPSPPSGRRHIWEVIAENMKSVPPEDLAALPKDGLSQIDHYVYGVPKSTA
jgi:hypothetical protein